MTEPQDQDRGEAPLHLVRLTLHEPELRHLGRCRGLDGADLDYLAHTLLWELFPEQCKPFALMDWQRAEEGQPRRVCILGLAKMPAAALVQASQLVAEPDAWRCLVLAGLEAPSSKPIADFPRGLRLGYRVRVCPTVGRHNGEFDVFAARCREAGEGAPVDREEVYGTWLAGQMDRSGGARVLSAHLASFRLRGLYRRRQGEVRVPTRPTLPDCTMQGVLEVVDPEAFRKLYARGIGRHRAFGFGMLLLSRAAAE